MKLKKIIAPIATAAIVAFGSVTGGSANFPFSTDTTASAATVLDLDITMSGYENYNVTPDEPATISIIFKGEGIARIGGSYSNSSHSAYFSKIEWRAYPDWCLAEISLTAPSGSGNGSVTLFLYDDYNNIIGSFTSNIVVAEATFYFNDMVIPTTITCGNCFNLGGTITCSTELSSVKGEVIDSSGNVVLKANSAASGKSFDIRSSAVNSRLTFGSLSAGSYTLRYTATASDGSISVKEYSFSVKSRFSASQNEDTVYNFLVNDMSYSKAAAIGVIANIAAESGFNPNIYGDSGTSYGICQWHNSRFTALKSFCSKRGLDYTDIQAQLQYLKYELEGTSVDRYLRSVSNDRNGAYNAAYYFCYHFERPANTNNTSIKRGNSAMNTYWFRH